MCHLAHIGRSRRRRNRNPKSQYKPPAHEAAQVNAGSLYTRADDDDARPDEHAPFAAFKVRGWSSYKGAYEVADCVDCVDDAGCGGAFVNVEAKVGPVLVVAVYCAHEGAVIAVDA